MATILQMWNRLSPDQHAEDMIQPVEGGCGEHKLARQYPAFEQDGNRIADESAGLLGGGHCTLLSILENQRATKRAYLKKGACQSA
jgi:hypothetical protein